MALAGVIGFLLGPPGCAPGGGESPRAGVGSPEPMRVVVSIPPLGGLVAPALPEGAELSVLIEPGRSPHGFQLAPSDTRTIAEADLVVIVGPALEVSIANLLARLGEHGPGGVVSFQALVDDHPEPAHEHGDDGHHHAGIDPHYWLDAGLCVRLIEACGAGNAALPPERVRAQIERVRALDAELRETLKPFRGSAIITEHAAFGRFAQRYGLRVAGTLRLGDSGEPTPGAFDTARGVIEGERGAGRRVGLFAEPQMNAKGIRRLGEAMGVPVGTLDPLGSGDWFAMMRANANEIARVLGEQAPSP